MTGLIHDAPSPGQATYDLCRLRLNGMIRRVDGTHRYVLTSGGTASPSSSPSCTTGS